MTRVYQYEFLDIPAEAKMTVEGDFEVVENRYGGILDELDYGKFVVANPSWVPEGWREHVKEVIKLQTEAGEEEIWDEDHGFSWPRDTNRIYRSRSAAQQHVNAITRWGGKAVLLEGSISWLTIDEANARRKSERDQKRVEALKEKIRAIDPDAA